MNRKLLRYLFFSHLLPAGKELEECYWVLFMAAVATLVENVLIAFVDAANPEISNEIYVSIVVSVVVWIWGHVLFAATRFGFLSVILIPFGLALIANGSNDLIVSGLDDPTSWSLLSFLEILGGFWLALRRFSIGSEKRPLF